MMHPSDQQNLHQMLGPLIAALQQIQNSPQANAHMEMPVAERHITVVGVDPKKFKQLHAMMSPQDMTPHEEPDEDDEEESECH
jgi:hypothetical protein